MKKRLIAIVLSVFLVIPQLVLAKETPMPLLNENFDNYAFNEVPGDISTDGVDVHVIERKGTNKALTGKAWGQNEFSIIYPLNGAENKVVFEADIKIDGKRANANILTVKCGSSVIRLLRYGEDGRAMLPDGRIIDGCKLGKWKSYALAVNFKKAVLDLYVDGEKIIKGHKFSFTEYSEPTEIGFYCDPPASNDFAQINLDNICVYNGSEVIPKGTFPTKGINNETVEFTETTSVPEGGKLYIYNDCSNKSEFNFTYSEGCNVEILKEDKTNSVLHLKKIANGKNTMCDFVFPDEMYNMKKYTVQFDIKILSNSGVISMFEIVDQSGVLTSAVSITNGSFYLNGMTVCSIATNTWYNIAIAYDNTMKVYSAYVNGVLRCSNRSLPYGEAHPMSGRTRIDSGSGAAEYYMDNIYVYSGNKLLTFTDEQKQAVVSPEPIGENEKQAKELLGSMSAFMTSNDTMFIEGEKRYYSDENAEPYIDSNGTFMVPSEYISKAFGANITLSGSKVLVNGNPAMTVGSCDVHSLAAKLDSAPATKEGILYLPLESVCRDVLSLYITFDERGMYLIDTKPITYTNSIIAVELREPIDIIYRYLQFNRPNGEEIYAAFKSHTPDKKHPRLITTPEDVEQIKKWIDEDEEFLSYLELTLKNANKYLTRDNKKQIFDGNNGTSFLSSARTIMSEIRCLGIAYTFTGDDIYAERCWQEMQNVMYNWASWNGSSFYLLDTSETSYGIVMGFDFLYDWLTPGQRQEVIDVVFDKHLDKVVKAYRGRHVRLDWVTTPNNNWGFVVNGGVIAACMALADEVEGERLETIKFALECAVKSLEVQMMSFYPDGAWAEGPGYWQYAVRGCGHILGLQRE